MTVADKVVVGIAGALILVSFLNPGGLFFGMLLGVLLLAAWFGGKYLLELEKSRRMGERSDPLRKRMAGSEENDGESRWRR